MRRATASRRAGMCASRCTRSTSPTARNIDRLAELHPDIDILVNNAGAIPGGDLQEIDEARWREAWDLKVFGYINMCRRFYALMKQRGAA